MSQKIGTKISCILTNRKVFSFRIDLIAQTSLLGFPQAIFIEHVCVVESLLGMPLAMTEQTFSTKRIKPLP